MKKINLGSGCIIFVIALLFVGCGSDDASGPNVDEFIRANVETISFETLADPSAVTAAKIEGSDFTTFLVQGVDGSGNAMILSIVEYSEVGTYDLFIENEPTGTAAAYVTQETAWFSSGDGGSGTITVQVDDDQETSGTFEFVGIEGDGGTSTRTVTNGTFRAKFE